MRKLDFLFRPLPWLTREEAVALESLIPLLEKPAYSLCAASTALLDRKRRILVPLLKTSEARNDALLSYWAIVQIMARLTLLASDTAARPWLAEMAQTFQWQRWTPSMPLVRERTCWLAACAARSVIAFGPAILPNYLGMLARSKHPMTTFDALYGLSAIALSEPEELTPLTHEVSSLRKVVIRNDPATHNFTDHLFSNCLATLYARGQVTDDAAALSQAFNWQRGKPNGLASSVAIRTDPTDTLSSGRIIGFAILPLVVEAPKESFYPVQSASSREHALHAREIEQFFRRAWIDSDAPSVVYH
jgi:hypothetical protein